MLPYAISEQRDHDLVKAREDGDGELRRSLLQVCRCGHPRHEHMAATGALGSFGGSACDLCWICVTFRPVGPEEETE